MLKPRVSDSVTRRSNVDTESLNDVLSVCAYWNYEGISKICVYIHMTDTASPLKPWARKREGEETIGGWFAFSGSCTYR